MFLSAFANAVAWLFVAATALLTVALSFGNDWGAIMLLVALLYPYLVCVASMLLAIAMRWRAVGLAAALAGPWKWVLVVIVVAPLVVVGPKQLRIWRQRRRAEARRP